MKSAYTDELEDDWEGILRKKWTGDRVEIVLRIFNCIESNHFRNSQRISLIDVLRLKNVEFLLLREELDLECLVDV